MVELDSEAWHLDPATFRSGHVRDFHRARLDRFTVRLIWEQATRRPQQTAAGLHEILTRRRAQAA